MKTIYLFGFILICVSSSLAKDLIVGTSYNGRLVWQEKTDYMGIPFKKRVKELFFSDPGQQIIKGVIVRETNPTEGNVIITAGGVGFSFVNLRLKSERGSGIYYSVEIYV